MRPARRSGSASGRPRSARRRKRSRSTSSATRSGVSPELAKELEDFGLLAPHGSGSTKRYPESDADVAATCAQLARYGVAPRNLRTFRTATGREAALLEQLVAPALRGRNPNGVRRRSATCNQLAELAGELSSLLFWRDLRDLAQ